MEAGSSRHFKLAEATSSCKAQKQEVVTMTLVVAEQ